eukprot:1755516-Prymnesium_polylepis.1
METLLWMPLGQTEAVSTAKQHQEAREFGHYSLSGMRIHTLVIGIAPEIPRSAIPTIPGFGHTGNSWNSSSYSYYS